MTNKSNESPPLIGAIAGAKGGVGKSMVTSNLGVHFAKGGLKVIVLDLDLGAANQHSLFGISRSHIGWTKWLQNCEGPLSDYIVQTKEKNLSIIPASGFISDVAGLSEEQKKALVLQIKALDADIVLLDLGAGSHKDTLDFFSLADLKLIVTTPEKTSLMNNFEFIKNVIYQASKRLFKNQPQLLEKVNTFRRDPLLNIKKLTAQIEKEDLWQAENLKQMCRSLDIFIIFNQVKRIEEAKLAYKLKKIAQSQLGIELKYPGILFYSEEIAATMQKMQPISLISKKSIPSRIFSRITEALIREMGTPSKSKGQISIAWDQIKKDFYRNRVEQKKTAHLF